ncbi:hypothetical protein EVG20_g2042 [Dentipellis fragilis]|uniref:WD40 repeat-like protein n=1 Tax=Dentipellis fragilis TaxID=205917 RepID=A0A4Y9ZC38_9AGAM|nr:hypothetical protein EVG20_g2042 [Dentipellis fragilis]
MPRDLPGFYFDPAKNRYFPLSSQPKPTKKPESDRAANASQSKQTNRTENQWSSSTVLKAKNAGSLYHSLQSARTAHNGRLRERSFRNIETSQLGATSRCDTAAFIPFNQAKISASRRASRSLYMKGKSSIYWAIHKAGFTRATSFGPSSNILYYDWSTERAVFITPSSHLVHDVWTSNFQDTSLVLGQSYHPTSDTGLLNLNVSIGMRKRALLYPDIDHERVYHKLPTGSDVLAVHQHQTMVYTGSRNGSIHRFDTRERTLSGLALLDDIFCKNSNSAIYLNVVNEWQLVVSTVRGNIELFDLRFPRGNRPVMSLHGQRNEHLLDLPHAISPCSKYLFAAGLDSRIRGWSLLTGQPLSPTPPISTTSTTPTPIPSFSSLSSNNNGLVRANPFHVNFDSVLTSLQAVEIGQQTCLYASSGDRLFRFLLGQQYIGP